ncbi:MAG: thiol peroxidase [Prevotella sp.]|nr:thiol peroxidase [Prevotella sp.]MCM1074761.1 thiol peroxidase [Ruminococcus sp.]
MEKITLMGNPMSTVGSLPEVGKLAPDFTLAAQDLSDIKLSDFAGKRVVLNIFPSLDTDVCAASVRRFNVEASKMPNTVVLCVSMDLPFAAARFCTINGIENVKTASGFRSDFGDAYGVKIADGPMRGLYARSLVVIDTDGTVIANELVSEITNEPDYTVATDKLK